MSVPARARHLRRLALLAATSLLLATGASVAAAATRPAGSPTGNLDKVALLTGGGVQVKGWAWDADTTATVSVRITAGSLTTVVPADKLRADVARVYPAAGSYRGFDTTLTLPGGTYTVCATALNVGAGADTAFPCKAITVPVQTPPPGAAPVGSLDEAVEDGQGVRVSGWASDPDSTTTPLSVVVRLDGAVAGTTTTGAGSAFTATVPAAPGSHEVCVTAIGVGTGGDTTACRTVAVRDHAPSGSLGTATEQVPGSLRVTGTARDIDTAAASVRLTMDGATVQVTAAASDPYAFTADLPGTPGEHEVCATVVNAGPGADLELGCVRGTLVDHDPQGSLTTVTDSLTGGLRVLGTATDADAPGSTSVRITVDGQAVSASTEPASGATLTALAEPASTGAFDLSVAAAPGTHRVCVTAVNVGPGADTTLGCTDVVVVDHAATGKLEQVAGGVSALTVSGWAADRDTTAPLTVSVTVDGVRTDLTASTTRSDVLAAQPDLGAVGGFSVTLPATPGSHEVCATVRNVGAGQDAALGCRTVTVAAPAPAVPGPTTTGVPAGQALTVYDGDLVVTTPGAVISNLDVRGYVRIKAANVTIKNSIVRGRSGLTANTGLVTNLDGYAGLVIKDTELVPAYPTVYINGFMGSNATFTRVNVHTVVDSIHVTGSNVVIDSSWLHDNSHYLVDPSQGGKPSHDDNVQVQAGTNIVIKNSVLAGAYNAAVMVTQDRGAVTGLVLSGNKLDNGACTVNLAEKTYGPIAATITGNSFGTGQIYKYCGVKAASTTTAVSTVSGNTFTDGRAFTVTP